MAASPAGTWSPRIDLVFRFWQCDKENHGWREGLPLTVSAKFRSEAGLHPPGKVIPERKREYCFPTLAATPHSEHWPVFMRFTEKWKAASPALTTSIRAPFTAPNIWTAMRVSTPTTHSRTRSTITATPDLIPVTILIATSRAGIAATLPTTEDTRAIMAAMRADTMAAACRRRRVERSCL